MEETVTIRLSPGDHLLQSAANHVGEPDDVDVVDPLGGLPIQVQERGRFDDPGVVDGKIDFPTRKILSGFEELLYLGADGDVHLLEPGLDAQLEDFIDNAFALGFLPVADEDVGPRPGQHLRYRLAKATSAACQQCRLPFQVYLDAHEKSLPFFVLR